MSLVRLACLPCVAAAVLLGGACALQAQHPVAPGLQRTGVVLPPLYGPLGVTPDAVKQGELGSCYFHAALAAIAAHHAGLLQHAILDLGDGRYTVRLADGTRETVYREDLVFGRQNKFDRSDGLWVTVLLRALAQNTLRQSMLAAIAATSLTPTEKFSASQLVRASDTIVLAYDRAIRAVVGQDGAIDRTTLKASLTSQARSLDVPITFSEPVIRFLDAQGFFTVLAQQVERNGELFGAYRSVGQGGLPTRVMRALGLTADTRTLADAEAVAALVRHLDRDRTAVVVTTGNSLGGVRNTPPAAWWVKSHAYTVVRYDPTSDTVRLRNPWGMHPAPDGDFDLPLSDFLADFADLDSGK